MKKPIKNKIRIILLLSLFLITSCTEDTDRTDYDYNISDVQGEGIIHLIRLANNWTNDVLIFLFLMSLFTISFISLKTVAPVKSSIAAASFILMLTTFLIKMSDIAKNNETMDRIVIASIVIFVFAAVALYFNKDEIRF